MGIWIHDHLVCMQAGMLAFVLLWQQEIVVDISFFRQDNACIQNAPTRMWNKMAATVQDPAMPACVPPV